MTKLAIKAIASAFPYTPAPTEVTTMSQDLYKIIFIIELMALKAVFDFEYAFCNWTYAMVLVALKFKSLTQRILFELTTSEIFLNSQNSFTNAFICHRFTFCQSII